MTTLNDNNRFLGRMKRYADVTTSVGKLVMRLAGQKVGISNKGDSAQELGELLGSLKGPMMKIAQLLATIPDAVPPEFVQPLLALQSNAPPMGMSFVKRRMAGELGADWMSRFNGFDLNACAAASLGQVHRATIQENQNVAVKLQYPDMASAIEADLFQIKIAMDVYERMNRALSTQEIFEEISQRLREELDYEREKKHIALYRDIFENSSRVHVPQCFDAWCTKRLLTLEWMDGRKLLDVKEWDLERRNRLAKDMFYAWYFPLYHYGVIHGDPHLGNYTIRDDGSINLLDFGCVRFFEPRFVKGVLDLYKALQTGDEEMAVFAYESWGFENLSKELIAVLNRWAGFLYGPLLDDRVRGIQETNSAAQGRELASHVHEELRRIGGVKPPREFVFMDRAAVGMGAVFMHLDASLNWCQLFQELTHDFDQDVVEKNQQEAMMRAHLKL